MGDDAMINMRVEVSIPRSLERFLDPMIVRRELREAVDHSANLVHYDFKRTIRTWRRKPYFRKSGPRETIGKIEATVSTDSEIYFFVEGGTTPHIIRPRRATHLRFQTGYRAKTRVGVVGSRPGGKFGPYTTRKVVRHPGFPSRQFSELIARNRARNVENLTRLALRRSLRFGGMR